MKKITSFWLIFLIITLCGCENKEKSETRFMLDTVVTLNADCNNEVMNGAFSICQNYDDLLSRTNKSSDVYKLNNSQGFIEINESTLKIIERSLYFSDISNGKFDITVCSVSDLWDFKNQVIPPKKEISEALKNVDYESIEIKDDSVNLHGKKIDLGGIAKGYIADQIKEYFTENGVGSGIINLGGNIVVFGKEYSVGIQRPFSSGIAAILKVQNKSVVTSGIYQRFIESDGEIYHHILDTSTGYSVQNELASVTVIGENSLDCDALSTVCMLLGTGKGMEIIESIPKTEAVFIDRKENLTLSSGLYKRKNYIYLK